MRNITISMAIVAITLPALTHAWGDAAHRAIGLLTKKLLRPEISPRLEAVLALDPVTKGDFGAAAAWADTVVADPKYASTKELHYAQMTGTSPQQCSKIESDARPESGNVYGAIDTYTHKMLYDKDVQEREQNKTRPESIKFLFNFLTDIFQPMHITAEYNNGRDAKLYWKNSQASLHDIWDTHLVEERLREFNDQPALYAEYLEKQIKQEGGASDKWPSWEMCLDDGKGSSIYTCVPDWMNEANLFNCNDIFPNYLQKDQAAFAANPKRAYVEYYARHKGNVDLFIKRAAMRAAELLSSFTVSMIAIDAILLAPEEF